MMIRNTER